MQTVCRPGRSQVFAAALVASLGWFAVAGSVGCPFSSQCFCAPCASAVSLSVVNTAGAPVDTGWSVEAALDGTVVDTSACDEGVRTGNLCAFGFDPGVYDIVVRTTTEEKHLVARSAPVTGQDCCSQCVATTNVPVVLGIP
jgi:hypothetical protein